MGDKSSCKKHIIDNYITRIKYPITSRYLFDSVTTRHRNYNAKLKFENILREHIKNNVPRYKIAQKRASTPLQVSTNIFGTNLENDGMSQVLASNIIKNDLVNKKNHKNNTEIESVRKTKY